MSEPSIAVHGDTILRTLRNNFPLLDLNYLKCFRQVYYPIAVVEADLVQEILEDFTVVELNLLRLLNSGFRDVDELAALMGLTSTYVSEVLVILQGYQHIDEHLALTPLGIRSLEQERSIRTTTSKRLLEVDAVNGYPLQPDQTIAPDGQKTAATLHNHDTVLMSVDTADLSLLTQVEKGFEQRAHLRYRQAINVNVRNVLSPTLHSVKYGCGFLLLLDGHAPLLFVKINTVLSEKRTVYRWQPLAVIDQQSADLLNWDEPLFYNGRGLGIVNGVAREVELNAKSEYAQESFLSDVPVVLQELHLAESGMSEPLPQVFCLRREAFTRLTSDVLRVLQDLGSVNNVSVYVKPDWCGNVVKFVRDIHDKRLAYVCQRIKYEIEQTDFSVVWEQLSAVIPTDKECAVIDQIVEKLNWQAPN